MGSFSVEIFSATKTANETNIAKSPTKIIEDHGVGGVWFNDCVGFPAHQKQAASRTKSHWKC